MDNSRLPAKALGTLVSGIRSQGRWRKKWINNVKEDLYQRGRDITQVDPSAEFVRKYKLN